MSKPVRSNLAETVYVRLKDDIFEFRMLPGERFTETEVATRMAVSRTPVREALYRLEREGHIEVTTRNGWNVRPLDFTLYDHLYDVRIVLEMAAIERLCRAEASDDAADALAELRGVWLVPRTRRLDDCVVVARLDEAFHIGLMAAAGNPEMLRIFRDIGERIRIIRRLDFTQPRRIQQTYEEHGRVLRAILARDADKARDLLRGHIESSKVEVKKITLHRLQQVHAGRVGGQGYGVG